MGFLQIPFETELPPVRFILGSSDETWPGTPDKSGTPVSVSSSVHRDLEVELALRDSPAMETEPSKTGGQTAIPLYPLLPVPCLDRRVR